MLIDPLTQLNAGTITAIVVILLVMRSLLRRSSLVPLIKVMEKRAARVAVRAQRAGTEEHTVRARRAEKAFVKQSALSPKLTGMSSRNL